MKNLREGCAPTGGELGAPLHRPGGLYAERGLTSAQAEHSPNQLQRRLVHQRVDEPSSALQAAQDIQCDRPRAHGAARSHRSSAGAASDAPGCSGDARREDPPGGALCQVVMGAAPARASDAPGCPCARRQEAFTAAPMPGWRAGAHWLMHVVPVVPGRRRAPVSRSRRPEAQPAASAAPRCLTAPPLVQRR